MVQKKETHKKPDEKATHKKSDEKETQKKSDQSAEKETKDEKGAEKGKKEEKGAEQGKKDEKGDDKGKKDEKGAEQGKKDEKGAEKGKKDEKGDIMVSDSDNKGEPDDLRNAAAASDSPTIVDPSAEAEGSKERGASPLPPAMDVVTESSPVSSAAVDPAAEPGNQ